MKRAIRKYQSERSRHFRRFPSFAEKEFAQLSGYVGASYSHKELPRSGSVFGHRAIFNGPFGGYYPDFRLPDRRLIIEIDGKSFHENRQTADRLRDERLFARGYKTIRIDAWGLHWDPHGSLRPLLLLL